MLKYKDSLHSLQCDWLGPMGPNGPKFVVPTNKDPDVLGTTKLQYNCNNALLFPNLIYVPE